MTKRLYVVRDDLDYGLRAFPGYITRITAVRNALMPIFETIAAQNGAEVLVVNAMDQVQHMNLTVDTMDPRAFYVVMDPVMYEYAHDSFRNHSHVSYLSSGRLFAEFDEQVGTTERVVRPEDAHWEETLDNMYFRLGLTIRRHLGCIDRIHMIDDDSATGFLFKQTYQAIQEQLHDCVVPPMTYETLLEPTHQLGDVIDVVDMRDFVFGANRSGLITGSYRVPYLSPYVNLCKRASATDQSVVNDLIFQANRNIALAFDGTFVNETACIGFLRWMRQRGLDTKQTYITAVNQIQALTNNIIKART